MKSLSSFPWVRLILTAVALTLVVWFLSFTGRIKAATRSFGGYRRRLVPIGGSPRLTVEIMGFGVGPPDSRALPKSEVAEIGRCAAWVRYCPIMNGELRPQLGVQESVTDREGRPWPHSDYSDPVSSFVLIPSGYLESPPILSVAFRDEATGSLLRALVLPQLMPSEVLVKTPPSDTTAVGVDGLVLKAFEVHQNEKPYLILETTHKHVDGGLLTVEPIRTSYGEGRLGQQPIGASHDFAWYPLPYGGQKAVEVLVRRSKPVHGRAQVSIPGIRIESMLGQPFAVFPSKSRYEFAPGLFLTIRSLQGNYFRRPRAPAAIPVAIDLEGLYLDLALSVTGPDPQQTGVAFSLNAHAGILPLRGFFIPVNNLPFGPDHIHRAFASGKFPPLEFAIDYVVWKEVQSWKAAVKIQTGNLPELPFNRMVGSGPMGAPFRK